MCEITDNKVIKYTIRSSHQKHKIKTFKKLTIRKDVKMTDKFQKHYVSLTFLSLLLIRILVCGASIGDSIAFLALVGFTAYSLYIQNKNKDTEIEFKNQLNELNDKLLAQTELFKITVQESVVKSREDLDTLQNELNALRQQVGLIKVDQGFQTKPVAPVKTPNEKKKYF